MEFACWKQPGDSGIIAQKKVHINLKQTEDLRPGATVGSERKLAWARVVVTQRGILGTLRHNFQQILI